MRALMFLVFAVGCCHAPRTIDAGPPPSGPEWLEARQRPDGSFGSPAATALASLALERAGHMSAAQSAWAALARRPLDEPLAAAVLAKHGTRDAQLALCGLQLGDGRWSQPGWPDELITAFACAGLERWTADPLGLARARLWLAARDASQVAGAWPGPARLAERRVRVGRAAGLLDADDPVVEETLEKLGLEEIQARSLAQAYRLDAAWPEREQLAILRSGRPLSAHEVVACYLTTEALREAAPARRAQWERALDDALRAQQRPDGSWCGSVVATAAAVLALMR